jgi:hypothetical protein
MVMLGGVNTCRKASGKYSPHPNPPLQAGEGADPGMCEIPMCQMSSVATDNYCVFTNDFHALNKLLAFTEPNPLAKLQPA